MGCEGCQLHLDSKAPVLVKTPNNRLIREIDHLTILSLSLSLTHTHMHSPMHESVHVRQSEQYCQCLPPLLALDTNSQQRQLVCTHKRRGRHTVDYLCSTSMMCISSTIEQLCIHTPLGYHADVNNLLAAHCGDKTLIAWFA